jgi:hypothetical protein
MQCILIRSMAELQTVFYSVDKKRMISKLPVESSLMRTFCIAMLLGACALPAGAEVTARQAVVYFDFTKGTANLGTRLRQSFPTSFVMPAH